MNLFFLLFFLSATASAANLPDTGVIISTRVGDDGYYKFPYNQQYFDIVTDTDGYSVAHDRTTGLDWAMFDQGPTYNWWQAVDMCYNLTWAGYTDWRLPNDKEMLSIYDLSRNLTGTAFPVQLDFIPDYYWTSTPQFYYGLNYFSLTDAVVGRLSVALGQQSHYALCVRGDYSYGGVVMNGFLGQMNWHDVSFWFGVFVALVIIWGFKFGRGG